MRSPLAKDQGKLIVHYEVDISYPVTALHLVRHRGRSLTGQSYGDWQPLRTTPAMGDPPPGRVREFGSYADADAAGATTKSKTGAQYRVMFVDDNGNRKAAAA
jgi:hypothetical protein